MAEEVPFRDQTTASQIKALAGSGLKVVQVRDAAGRLETLYEAPVHSEIGEPCLRTRYKYLDGAGGTSRTVIAYSEDVVAWPGFEAIAPGSGNDFDLVP
jgi:hypothetical protein